MAAGNWVLRRAGDFRRVRLSGESRGGGCQTGDSSESIKYVAPTRVAADFARTQFMHADTDHARQAVLLQIQLLEKLELVDKSFHADDFAFAYTRLALIEEATGRPEAAQRALARATARYSQMYPSNKELTDDELRNEVKRLDSAIENL